MDTRDVLIAEIFISFAVTFVVTAMYGVVAPWYKQSAGRYIFGLLASLTAILANSVFRIIFPDIMSAQIIAVILFAYYIIAILSIGAGVYKAQVRGYLRSKFVVQEKERHREF